MAFNRKIYVVGGAKDYANWMEREDELVHRVQDADLLVFTGGSDVNPRLYREKRHPLTFFQEERDSIEAQVFLEGKELKKKMIGICRGAQFLCVMSGGTLVQHQANVDRVHIMHTDTLFDGKKDVLTTSDHHQAQFPWHMRQGEFSVLGWTYDQSPYHLDGDEKEMVIGNGDGWEGKEVEVCYYPKTLCLGIQGHPEWMFPKRLTEKESNESITWFRTLLNRFMWGSL